MIVKQIKEKDFEIIISANLDGTCVATLLKGNNHSNSQSMLDLESALDTFDYWYEGEKGIEKHD